MINQCHTSYQTLQQRLQSAGVAAITLSLLIAGLAGAAHGADPETELAKLIGKPLADGFAGENGLIVDPLLDGWIQRLGAQLAARSPRQNLHYHYAILNSAEPNAFTLPGGYIFITRGLLDFADSQDEVAGVMGHETGHVAGNHAMRLIEWQLGSSLAVTYGLPRTDLAEGLGQGVVLLATLHFSRQDEFAADQYGIRFATEAGYDPQGLVSFFQQLGVEKHPTIFDRYLSTHPPDIDRIRALEKTRFLDQSNWQVQEQIGDRLFARHRPVIASTHYAFALAAAPSAPIADRIRQKLRDARILAGIQPPGEPPAPAAPTPSPPVPVPAAPAPAPRTADLASAEPKTGPEHAADSIPIQGAANAPAIQSQNRTIPDAGQNPPSANSPGAATSLPPSADSGTEGPARMTKGGPGSRKQPEPVPEDPRQLNQETALSSLRAARREVGPRVDHAFNRLRASFPYQKINGMTRDALLAAVPSRLGDIRWLALAYQAYVDAARLSDAYSRVYRVERRLQQSLADMEMEVMKSGGESQHGQEVCAAALRLSREAGAAARDGAAAADHVQRAEVMLAAVMGDLASVLVGFNAQVGNIRFASVEAALLAADHEINEGRSRSARALDSAALCEDRVLLVQLNRIGVESPHQNALFEQEAADLVGVAPEQLHALRSDGLELGDAVALLALSQDIGKEAHEVVAAFHRLQVFRSLQPGWPVSCIDGILEQHGRADLIEIMLRQVFYTINEEKQSA